MFGALYRVLAQCCFGAQSDTQGSIILNSLHYISVLRLDPESLKLLVDTGAYSEGRDDVPSPRQRRGRSRRC